MKTEPVLRFRRVRRLPADLHLKPSLDRQVQKEVLPLLRAFRAPSDEASNLARDIIKRTVVENHSAQLSSIDKLLFLVACRCSTTSLPGYATLDQNHIASITDLLKTISRYVQDTSQERPLVFLMLASPGAGKSHFIKCVAKQLSEQNVGAITYNMAGLQSNEDLIPPLDDARNLKVDDCMPLLFLDEFDSTPSNIPMLLPLLWDGEVAIGSRGLRLGRSIIVLAGSHPSLPTTMEQARSMQKAPDPSDDQSPKIIDLLSRVNGGVIAIPPFFDQDANVDRRSDKVCVTVHLLRRRLSRELREAPLSLLRFVANTNFRYGVRSIAHLVDLIPFRKEATTLTPRQLALPFSTAAGLKQSSLAYHLLHHEQADGVLATWKQARVNDAQMPIDLDFVSRALSAVAEPEDKEAAADVLWRFHARFPSAPVEDSFIHAAPDTEVPQVSDASVANRRRQDRPKREQKPTRSVPKQGASGNGGEKGVRQ